MRGCGCPLTQPSPPRGRGLERISPLPVGEGWVRALFSSHPRVPREGGDPDPFTRTENGPLPRLCEAHRAEATQGIITSGPRQSPGLLRCARNDAVRIVEEHPLTQPSPPRGARARTDKPSPCGRGLGEGLVSFLPCSPRRRGPRTLHAGWNQRSGPPPSRGTRLIGERVFLMLSLSKHEEAALNDTNAHVPTMFLLFKRLRVLDRSA